MNQRDKVMWGIIGESFRKIDKCNNEIKEAAEREKKQQDKYIQRINRYKDRIKQLKGGN